VEGTKDARISVGRTTSAIISETGTSITKVTVSTPKFFVMIQEGMGETERATAEGEDYGWRDHNRGAKRGPHERGVNHFEESDLRHKLMRDQYNRGNFGQDDGGGVLLVSFSWFHNHFESFFVLFNC
jgi:hypothetical protein